MNTAEHTNRNVNPISHAAEWSEDVVKVEVELDGHEVEIDSDDYETLLQDLEQGYDIHKVDRENFHFAEEDGAIYIQSDLPATALEVDGYGLDRKQVPYQPRSSGTTTGTVRALLEPEQKDSKSARALADD
jgi:ribosomal protein S18 acetylase RimI-like enzyme